MFVPSSLLSQGRRHFGFGRAVGSRIRTGKIQARFSVVIDCLAAPHKKGEVTPHIQLMAHAGKLLTNFARDAVLDSQGTQRRLAKTAPHATVRLLPGVGHFPAGQAAPVLDFLRPVLTKS